jgi:hypothetical protein
MSAPEIPVYSTVTVERVEYQDENDELVSPPIADGLEIPDPLDPEGAVADGDPALLVAVHAPEIAPDDPDDFDEIGDPVEPMAGSTEDTALVEAEDDGAPSRETIIGGVYLPPGVYDDIEVPILPPAAGEIVFLDEVFPPNPNGDTDVVVQAWGLTAADSGDDILQQPLSLDGEPLRDSATVSDLDRNPDRAPIGDGLNPEVSAVFPFGTEDEQLRPPGVVLSRGEFGSGSALSFNGETDTLSTAPTPVKDAAAQIENINDGITAPTSSDEYFILGLHHPDVGSGDPTMRDSLVGIAPLPLGEFTSVRVPVSETPFTDSGDFPPSQDAELTVTLWHGPAGEFQGPINGPTGDPLMESVFADGLFGDPTLE